MSPTFSDDDIGKPVETADGDAIGVVAAVDGETAYVDPESGITDSTRAALDREASADPVPLGSDAVARITDDAVQLEDEFPAESIASGAAEEADAAGGPEGETDAIGAGEADESAPTETAGNETESEVDGTARGIEAGDGEANRDANDVDESGPGMDDHAEPDEAELMDAAEEIDGDAERSGSSVDPGGEGGETDSGTRDDVDVDPDDVTEGDPEAEIRSEEDVG